MNYDTALQGALDYIDLNIKSELSAAEISQSVGYSAFHFTRVFARIIGVPVMTYVTWRKLQYALSDLARGEKVVDVAMDYGFETHAGFTKAFKHRYGFPPSMCRLRLSVESPAKARVAQLKNIFFGGNSMNPHIIEVTPFYAVGYPTRHTGSIKTTGDAPTFWNTLDMDCGAVLTKLYNVFPRSKHCEISLCYDVDESGFTYMLGRGIDDPEDLKNIEHDMTKLTIGGGLYAIFSTPPVAETYIETVQETWNEIFTNWLPQSEFEYDETRHDFEYHDHRDHGWYFGGKLQIDIFIPIKQKAEERRKSELRIEG